MMGCLRYYLIKEGDTLSSISSKFDTTPQNLLRLNPSLEPDNLIPGTRICVISSTIQPVFCPLGSISYNINQGDTLADIAERFGSSASDILLANPTINPYNLKIGERICIPQKTSELPVCDSGNYYVIRRGDTLSSIAAAFDVDVRDILSLNDNLNPNNLSIGQIICIPIAPSPIEIIINVSAKRLAVYRNGSIYREYIVATGREETPTPIGVFTIINKEIDPGGPYGTRWLGLSEKGYGIHGTNNPASIGTAASNGCIRMYNEDIEALFDITSVGTVVRILP